MDIKLILFYAVCALILFFGFKTGLYFLMAYNFIALVQIMVYVGGIVVLIIFSILLTQSSDMVATPASLWKKTGALAISVCGFLVTTYLLINHNFPANNIGVGEVKITNIGNQLLDFSGSSGYLLPFELITILLLAVLVGSILIAFKPNKDDEKGLKPDDLAKPE
jgi:NADH-quinone oxidoreductase subunit J